MPKETQSVKSDDDLYAIFTGTGFFVNKNGYVVTNDHVTKHCVNVLGNIKGKHYEATIMGVDEHNDLSLLRFDYKNKEYISFGDPVLGELILAIGYPLSDELGVTAKPSGGVVNDLIGGKNTSKIQIDAAIQSGNSGGPIMNLYGNAVGVVVSSLIGEDVQNVNFGIKSDTVIQFLSSYGIKVSKKSRGKKLETEIVSARAIKSTIHIVCLNTLSVYNEILKAERNVRNLIKKPKIFKKKLY